MLLARPAARAFLHNARDHCGPGAGDRDGRAAFRHAVRDRGALRGIVERGIMRRPNF